MLSKKGKEKQGESKRQRLAPAWEAAGQERSATDGADGMGLPPGWPAGLPLRDAADESSLNTMTDDALEELKSGGRPIPRFQIQSPAVWGPEATESVHTILCSAVFFFFFLTLCFWDIQLQTAPGTELHPNQPRTLILPRLQCRLVGLSVMMELPYVCIVHFRSC